MLKPAVTALAIALAMGGTRSVASAAVPLRWTVETSKAAPAAFEAYHGETLAFAAALNTYGRPLADDLDDPRIYWQTNGMGAAYWSAEASVSSNVLSATWRPQMDVGATLYNCFIGCSGTIYRAAFQLRMRPSPGAEPNTLPLPTPYIDFARVTVLNPPYYTRTEVETRIADATNALRHVDAEARPLPPYLHALDFDSAYPEEAERYYASRHGEPVGCSARRIGNLLERNFDFPFDDRAEFVVRVTRGADRFASVGVANVGTNLTEGFVTSGMWSPYYKALPGAVTDGINANGVVAEINVVDGDPSWHTNGTVHPLAAVRWTLDHATNAQQAAEFLADNIRFPNGWRQNYHYMIADAGATFVVENGETRDITAVPAVLTNFRLFPTPGDGPGQERYAMLVAGESITNAWYTRAYRRETTPPWVSDLHDVLAYTNEIFDAWEAHPKEYFRNQLNGGQSWWQTVHTSVYDIKNKTLRVAVQERDDWYSFAIDSGGGDVDKDGVMKIIAGTYVGDYPEPENDSVLERVTNCDVGLLVTNDVMMLTDRSNIVWSSASLKVAIDPTLSVPGAAADAKATGDEIDAVRQIVYTWGQFLDGSNVVFSITNYISGAYSLDAANLRIQELKETAPGVTNYVTVYDSRAEITNHTEATKLELVGVVNATAAVFRAEIDRKADKAWGKYASDGSAAPSNTVVITAPSTVFAGGHEFQRVNTGLGTVGILVSRGAATYTGDPGTFRFRDAMTGEYFGYVKNTYTLGVHTDGINVDASTHVVTLTYNVTMSTYPIIKYLPDLEDYDPDEWEPLNDILGNPIPGASHVVSWETPDPAPGKKVCYINCTEPQGFFCAEIAGVAGDCKFETNMAADLKGGIVAHDSTDTNVFFAVEAYVEAGQVKWRVRP